jgi:hypothetical protein
MPSKDILFLRLSLLKCKKGINAFKKIKKIRKIVLPLWQDLIKSRRCSFLGKHKYRAVLIFFSKF